MNGEQDDVSPKNQAPEIQSDPIAAARSESGLIKEIDGSRQQPKRQTNDQVFLPDGLHRARVDVMCSSADPLGRHNDVDSLWDKTDFRLLT